MEIGGTRERNLHEILLCWGIFDVLIEMPRALLICRRTLALFINKCFNFKTATKALHARELQIPFAQRLQHAQLTRNMKMTEKKRNCNNSVQVQQKQRQKRHIPQFSSARNQSTDVLVNPQLPHTDTETHTQSQTHTISQRRSRCWFLTSTKVFDCIKCTKNQSKPPIPIFWRSKR